MTMTMVRQIKYFDQARDLTWIIESNRIEGIRDPQEDRRSLNAWRWFIRRPLTRKTILECHRRILCTLDPDIAGIFRTCNIRVGTWFAPNWTIVPNMMQDWLTIHGEAAAEADIRAAHIAFERIHPFTDGNGRTGRMIMHWQRVHMGLEPLLIRFDEREKYYQWFAGLGGP